MTALIDIISPDYLDEKRIKVSVDPDCEPLMAFKRIIVNFNYDATYPEGVILPLILTVQPGSGGGVANGYRRKVFRRVVPSSYTFVVPGAGKYLVLLKEEAHNYWQGRLIITVGGDPVSTRNPRERRV